MPITCPHRHRLIVTALAMALLGGTTAQAQQVLRTAPAGFSAGAAQDIDRVLVWQGQEQPAIVFVAPPQRAGRHLLTAPSVGSFQRLLVQIGFESRAADAWARSTEFVDGTSTCLALAAAPEQCISLRLQPRPDGRIELQAEDRQQRLLPGLTSRDLDLTGTTQVSVGGTSTPTQSSRSASIDTRGTLSRGDLRLEYSVAAYSNSVTGTATQPVSLGTTANAATGNATSQTLGTGVRYTTLAARIPTGQGSAIHAGLFPSGNPFGGMSFDQSTLVGVAWRSGDASFASFGEHKFVRLVLRAPAYVRLLSGGVQLFEGNLGAGDQRIDFAGITGPFVDAQIRDSSGLEVSQRAEVFQDSPEGTRSSREDQLYADLGRPVLQPEPGHYGLRYSDDVSASVGYQFEGFESLRLQLRAQSVGSMARAGVGLLSRDHQWTLAGSVGRHGERSLTATLNPQLPGGWLASANASRYRSADIADPAACLSITQSCIAGQDYRSWGLSLGHQDWPVRVGYLHTSTQYSRVRLYTLMSVWRLPMFGHGSQLVGTAIHNPDSHDTSISLSLIVPIDGDTSATASAGLSSNLNGQNTVSAGYARQFDDRDGSVLRSASLGVSRNQDSTGANSYVTAQLGPVGSHLAMAKASNGTASAYLTLTSSYGVSEQAGPAFAADSAAFNRSGEVFGEDGMSALQVVNRSVEPQTLMIDGRQFDVPPESNLLIPISQGYVRDLSVTPGPALNEGDLRQTRVLHKGNIQTVQIARGAWVLARFLVPDPRTGRDAALPAQFTYRRDGEKLERIYPDAQQRALLFELIEDDRDATRYITVPQHRAGFACVARREDLPSRDDHLTYKELGYRCTPLDGQPYTPPSHVPDNLITMDLSNLPPTAAGIPTAAASAAPAPEAVIKRFAVFFDFGKARLRPVDIGVLRELQDTARQASRVEVIGRTDRIGPDDFNQRLAWQRSLAVVRALMASGIARENIRVRIQPRLDVPLAPDTQTSNHAPSSLPEQARRADANVEIVLARDADPAAATSPASVASTTGDVMAEVELLGAVRRWAQAWSAKDYAAYRQFYAPDFRTDRLDTTAWEHLQHTRLTSSAPIFVDISNIEVRLDQHTATTRFLQRYMSGRQSDRSVRTLTWKRKDTRWVIVQEPVDKYSSSSHQR